MLVLCFKQMSIGSLWVEIEKGITKASFSCDIKTGFSELWPGFLPLHVRHLHKVPKSLTSTAASRLQLFFQLASHTSRKRPSFSVVHLPLARNGPCCDTWGAKGCLHAGSPLSCCKPGRHSPRLKSCSYEMKVFVSIKDVGFPVQTSKYTFSFCFTQLPTCLKLKAHAEC